MPGAPRFSVGCGWTYDINPAMKEFPLPLRINVYTSPKAGVGLLSTALTLPVGTAPGRYAVEPGIETENGRDSARSEFSVVSRLTWA